MKKICKTFCILFAVLLLGTVVWLKPVKAATKKIYYSDFTMTKSNMKKPANLKKGKTTVTLSDGKGDYKTYKGYAKFKASKKKKYTFTFSNLTNQKYTGGMGYVQFMVTSKQGKKWVAWKKVSTQGGKVTNVNIGTNSPGTGKNAFLPSRDASFKIKKGETVYMFFSFINGSNLDVKIK